MANIYYNEETGLPEFKVGIFGFFLTITVLLLWIIVKTALFIVKAVLPSGGMDGKIIIKK